MKEKPNEKYNNPQDEEEIRVAKATLGYFHLKTSSDYVVPEHLRSNTRQKRRKIANMTIQIYNQKKVFNEKVRKARDEKIAIRSEIISLTDQISKVRPFILSSCEPGSDFICKNLAATRYAESRSSITASDSRDTSRRRARKNVLNK